MATKHVLRLTLETKIINSSHILAAAYIKGARLLFIVFKTNDMYSYKDVSIEEWEALKAAESKGKYFHKNIRNNKDARKEGNFKDLVAQQD